MSLSFGLVGLTLDKMNPKCKLYCLSQNCQVHHDNKPPEGGGGGGKKRHPGSQDPDLFHLCADDHDSDKDDKGYKQLKQLRQC